MKRFFLLVSAALLGWGARAESTQTSEWLEAQTARHVRETPLTLDENKPNTIRAGRVSYSGIVVEAIKVENPLELLNPAAPAEYGAAEENFIRNPAERRMTGLKIFSIEF